MAIGVRLQVRLFIVGDGVNNSLTLPLGDFPLQDFPRRAVILATSTDSPTVYAASVDATGRNIIVSTVSGDPFPINSDNQLHVDIAF